MPLIEDSFEVVSEDEESAVARLRNVTSLADKNDTDTSERKSSGLKKSTLSGSSSQSVSRPTDPETGDCTPISQSKNNSQTDSQVNLMKIGEANDCVKDEVKNSNMNCQQPEDEFKKVVLEKKPEVNNDHDSEVIRQVNKSLTSKILELEGLNSNLKSENIFLREKLESQKKNSPSQYKSTDTVSIIEKYERDRQNTLNQLEEYEKVIISKNNEIQKLKFNCDDINGLQSELNFNGKLLEKLHSDNIGLKALNDENMSKYIKAMKDSEDLQKNLKDEIEKLHKRISVLSALDLEHKNKMKEISTNNATYKTEMAVKEKELCELRNANIANKQFSDALKKKQKTHVEKIEYLENEILKLNEKNKEIQKTVSNISGNNGGLKKELTIKEKEMCKLRIKNKQLSVSLNAKLNNLEKELCILRIKNKQLSISLEKKEINYMRNIKSLENDIFKLRVEKEELQNMVSENSTNNESLEIEVTLKKKELDKMHIINKQLSDALNKKVEELENNILKSKASTEELKNAKLTLQQEMETLRKNLNYDIANLEKTIFDLKEQLVLTQNSLDKANTKIIEIENNHIQLNKTIKIQDKIIIEDKKKIEELEKEIYDLTDKINTLEDLKYGYVDKNNSLKKFLAMNEALVDELRNENVEIKRDLAEKASDAEKFKELMYIARDEISFKQNIIEQLNHELLKL